MALPFTSLSAASSTGAGSSRDLEELVSRHTLIASVTGSPSQATIALEGSHDGVTWARLVDTSAQPTQGNPAAITGSIALVRFVRANLVGLSGGSSPTVTATIASDLEEI